MRSAGAQWETGTDAQHRRVLLALQPQVMGSYLRDALLPDQAARKDRDACHILDAKYEPGAYCTILYQCGERLLTGTLRWDAQASDGPETAGMIEPSGMQVYAFPHDPALPQLATALHPHSMARALGATLPECVAGQARVLRCRTTVLRYRPGKRCTLRVELRLRDQRTAAHVSQTLFVKLYHKASKAAAVYEEMRRLADAPPVRDHLLAVADAIAFVPDLHMVVQTPCDGVPLQVLLDHAARPAQNALERAAVALAALHATTPVTTRLRPIESELARFEHRAARIAAVDATQGRQLGALAAMLPRWLGLLPTWGAELRLAHGDCKPSQFLIGSHSIALLDFDHCGLADPASDVGTFLATLRQMGVHRLLKARGSIAAHQHAARLLTLEQHFLETYCAASMGGPELRLRATWYQAVALLRKALRSFARSPASRLTNALVTEGRRCLRSLPDPHASSTHNGLRIVNETRVLE